MRYETAWICAVSLLALSLPGVNGKPCLPGQKDMNSVVQEKLGMMCEAAIFGLPSMGLTCNSSLPPQFGIPATPEALCCESCTKGGRCGPGGYTNNNSLFAKWGGAQLALLRPQ